MSDQDVKYGAGDETTGGGTPYFAQANFDVHLEWQAQAKYERNHKSLSIITSHVKNNPIQISLLFLV